MIHNGSTYDYHFIIKELAEEFEGEFESLSENTEKYITFSVPIKMEITTLSNLVDKLSEGLHNDRCIDCKSCIDYMTAKDEQLIFR